MLVRGPWAAPPWSRGRCGHGDSRAIRSSVSFDRDVMRRIAERTVLIVGPEVPVAAADLGSARCDPLPIPSVWQDMRDDELEGLLGTSTSSFEA